MYFLVGRGVGRRILDALREAKDEIIVVSPWIGAEFAQLLKQKADKNVRVMVMTTEDGLSNLLSKRFGKMSALSLLIGTLLVMGSLVLFPYPYGPIAAAIFFAVAVVGAILLREETPAVPTTLVDDLHAKIYIVDGKAFLTSANLTTAGLYRNVEFLLGLEGEFVKQIKESILTLARGCSISEGDTAACKRR